MKRTNNNSYWAKKIIKGGPIDKIFWIVYVLVGGIFGGLILYNVTGNLVFKRIGVICLIPFALAFLIWFFVSNIVSLFISLIPGHKKIKYSFLPRGELPWWGALIWLVILSVFLIAAVPFVLDNILINLGVKTGEITLISSTIEQTTIWGMFKAWVMGERTLTNSIVSWIIIFIGIGLLTWIGWVVKKLWLGSGK